MSIKTYLGNPPANIVAWIKAHSQPEPSELGIPLYFEANESGATVAMLAWNDDVGESTNIQCHLEYSTDNMSTWTDYDGSIIYLDSCIDNKVYFRADPENPNTYGFYDPETMIGHYFKTEGSVGAGGNIQFMLESTGTRTDVPAYGFAGLFGHPSYDDETGEEIPDCASLTTAPALPVMTLNEYCYASMFHGCRSLTQAPALPATTLAEGCYSDMFNGCTSLTQAPALPATTLAEGCYSYMFYGCTHLNYMEVSFTEWSPSSATEYWVEDAGTQASGTKTFKCPGTLPQTFGDSNIPTGWTVI